MGELPRVAGGEAVITNPFLPGYYGSVNRILLEAWKRDVEGIREDIDDEVAEAALAGRPGHARYLEHFSDHPELGRLNV